MIRGVVLAALAVLALAPPAGAQDLALTFDDLPAHSALPPGETRLGVIARLVAAMADAGVPPSMGFINASGLETRPEDRAVLKVWRAAGHPLGNHGWSHANLDAIGAEAFATELVGNEPLLETLAGDTDWRWFRYPFLAEGLDPAVRQAARATLRERGYKVASVTMDFSDWAFNEPWARCKSRGDAAGMARLEALFLASAAEAFDASRALSQRLYGRDIPYVVLMHVGALDAHMMPRLLALFQARGARFVTLDEAMADPFYEADLKVTASSAPLTLENAAVAAGLAVPRRTEVRTGLADLCR
ncbi:MAG: polysaccharide deacetylase family protein [Caulobacteraceae bacterium]|nr:polysaccharide deacetylase family protein [Caulobacteraceae bacterium]